MMQLFIVFKLLVKVRNMLLSIRFQIQKNKFHIFDIFKKTIHRTDNTPLVLHHSLNNYLKRASYFILHFQKIKTFRNILKLIDSVIYIYIYIYSFAFLFSTNDIDFVVNCRLLLLINLYKSVYNVVKYL